MTLKKSKSSASEQRRSKRALQLVDQVAEFICANSGTEVSAVIKAIGHSENDVCEAMTIAHNRGLVMRCRRHCIPALWFTVADGEKFVEKQRAEQAKRLEERKARSVLQKWLAREGAEAFVVSEDDDHDDWPAARVVLREWEKPSAPPAPCSIFDLARLAA